MKQLLTPFFCLLFIGSFLTQPVCSQSTFLRMARFTDAIENNSEFFYGGVNSGISSLSASYADNQINIQWKTTDSVVNHTFKIERSYDGEHFEATSNRSLEPNEEGSNEYSFTDLLSPKKTRQRDIFYRLAWKNEADSFTYTKPMLVRVNTSGTIDYITAFPHPESNDINMVVSLREQGYVVARLSDNEGSEILNQTGHIESGNELLALSGTNKLNAGTYWLEVRVNSKPALKLRLIKE
jgi:hypothetical protein